MMEATKNQGQETIPVGTPAGPGGEDNQQPSSVISEPVTPGEVRGEPELYPEKNEMAPTPET